MSGIDTARVRALGLAADPDLERDPATLIAAALHAALYVPALCDALDAARANAEYDQAFMRGLTERAEQAEAAVARVRAYAEQHADWCCAKGCTFPIDRCDESCNCESGAILAAIDGATPPPSVGHRAPLPGGHHGGECRCELCDSRRHR